MELETKLEVFITKVSEWMNTTSEYRKELCRKNEVIRDELKEYKMEMKADLKIITDKIIDLPCKAREEITKGVRKEQDKLWLFINGIIIAIIGSWIGMIVKK